MDKIDNANGIAFHRAPLWRRLVASVVILTFGGLVTAPAVAATRVELERQERTAPREKNQGEHFNTTLLDVKERLRIVAGEPAHRGAATTSESVITAADRTAAREALKELHQQLREHDSAARADFNAIEQHLKDNNLPDVILQRHYDAVAKYETEANALLSDLAAIATATDKTRVMEVALKAFDRLDQYQLQRTHKPFDPERMPFGMPEKAELPEPAVTAEQFRQREEQRRSSLAFDGAAARDTSLAVSDLDDPTDPAYLGATLDIQITPAIEQLAAELEHDPVRIHNWVRNNIDYLPTYGSIQGAQLTLDNRKGNAFDTASLLIALLRASNIPARYAYGTVELPIAQTMNWLGNLESPHAAGNLLGQGGIPATLIVNGGQVTHLRFEHAWVEAWVDFYPSRGAIHRVGDAWVPMDASFKQYSYSDGMDLQTEVPFDAETFANQVIDSAVINESEGWVQGVDQALIQDRMNQYRVDVEAFIDAQDPGTTVGEVLGSKTIIEENYPILAGSLPMRHIVTGARYAELPDTARLKFRYQLQDAYGSPLATFEQPSVQLAGKRLAVSFRPATDADAELIASYLPEPPADGTPIDPGQLPDTLPGYLIYLTAEITLDGDVIETGPTVTMGSELNAQLGYRFPNRVWELRPKTLIAGEYQAVGLDLAGIAQSQLAALKTDLEHVQTQLESENPEGLTRHSLTGNLLQTGVLSYLALNDVQDQLAAKQAGIVNYRMPSFGTFSTTVQTHYWWGIPRDVSFPGVTMDIDYLYSQRVDKQNEQEDIVNFGRATGPRMSALEHLVPEQLFSTEDNPAEGISAVKAIALAQAEGQRVYTLNSGNLNTALAVITATPEIESEIRNAVLNGKEVTIHQSEINHYGWSGHGYIIFDPVTGAGAYKIGGGADGSETADDEMGAAMFIFGIINTFIEYLGDAVSKALAKAAGVVSTVADMIDAINRCYGIMQLVIPVIIFSLALLAALLTMGIASGIMFSILASIGSALLVDEYC